MPSEATYIPGAYITTMSATDIKYTTDLTKAAGQTFDMNQFHDTKKFGGGETSPLQLWLRQQHENGVEFDPVQAYQNLDVYGIMASGPYHDPDKSTTRTAKAAYSFKHEYGAKSFCWVPTNFPCGRAERGPGDDVKVMGYMNTVRWSAKILRASGVDRVITMHAHTYKIADIYQEEFGNPDYEVFTDINPVYVYADFLLKKSRLSETRYWEDGGGNIVFLHLDTGAGRLMHQLQEIMGLPNAKIIRFKKLVLTRMIRISSSLS